MFIYTSFTYTVSMNFQNYVKHHNSILNIKSVTFSRFFGLFFQYDSFLC